MILLRDLLETVDKEERSVWRTYSNRFGARNTLGQVRYFKDRDAAAKFARGAIKGHHPGWPEKKVRKDPKNKKQGYDYIPVKKRDMETVSEGH